jgi:hypothetical protein
VNVADNLNVSHYIIEMPMAAECNEVPASLISECPIGPNDWTLSKATKSANITFIYLSALRIMEAGILLNDPRISGYICISEPIATIESDSILSTVIIAFKDWIPCPELYLSHTIPMLGKAKNRIGPHSCRTSILGRAMLSVSGIFDSARFRSDPV